MKKNKHGGSRKGSGRKKGKRYTEPTEVMRVPASLINHVSGLIKIQKETFKRNFRP